MRYVEGFLLPVPTANKQDFRDFAEKIAGVFKAHGALQIMECWGVDVPDGEVTSMPMAVKKAENETVVFSWVIWESKPARDAAMEKIVEDPVFNPENTPVPFDGKRMILGGFEPILEA